MPKVTFTNPIAYAKRASCANIDACNAVGVGQVTLTNGMLVTLGAMNSTPATAGMGYVYNVTPTTANTAVDVWMVVTPPVPVDGVDNIYIDPRAYAAPAGRPVDIVRPMPGVDVFHVSAAAFGTSNQQPDVTTNKFVTASADGLMIATNTAASITGIVFQCIGVESIPVGQEMVTGYILKCIQNPLPALS